MADNVAAEAVVSSGATFAADDISSVYYPRSKITIGADGVNDGDVSATNPMPVKGTGTAGTANAGVVTIQGIASMTPVQIADNSSSITVDNGGTFAVQASLQAGTAYAGKVRLTDGTTDTDIRDLSNSNALNVAIVDGSGDQITSFGGGTQYTEGDTDASITGTAVMFESNTGTNALSVVSNSTPLPISDAGGAITVDNGGTFAVQAAQSGTWTVTGTGGTFPVTDSGGSLTVDAPVGTPVFVRLSDGSAAITTLAVSLASVPSHAVTNAGTFAVQAAQSGTWTVDLGATDNAVLDAIAASVAGTLTVGSHDIGTVTTVTTVSTLTGGGVAHDSADSGNPHKIGARAAATLSDDTMVANGDRTDAVSDLDGALLMRVQYPLGDIISERVSNTDGSSTAFTNFGATASARNVITAVVLHNASASDGYVDFRDGTAGSILYSVPIPAGGGAILPAGATPYFRTSANTALAFDVSAALTTVYISVTGFKSKV